MVRLTLSPDGVHIGGVRRRTVYFEDLAGASAEGRRLHLRLLDGERLSVGADAGIAQAMAAEVQAALTVPEAGASLEGARSVIAAWAERTGFAAAPFVTFLIRSAAALGASDLHLQPQVGGGHGISARIDGVLQALGSLAPARAARVLGRLKVIAGVKVHRADIPQEGRAEVDAGWVRLGFAPGVGGEAVTLRLFDRLKGAARLADLGLPPEVQAGLEALLAEPQGVILFAGPSASGKTTTAYTALRSVLADAGGTRRALTVEDPVEYRLEGVVQLEPDPGRGLTGAALLEAALRQDADVLVVGEARDAASVELMLRAGLTGHLVLGTVHAGDAAEALIRLSELGAPPALLSAAVLGVVAQRLVRVRAADGYAGRTAVAELLVVDAAVRRAIAAGAERGAVLAASGHAPLRTHAEALVARGVTDAPEVRRALGVRR